MNELITQLESRITLLKKALAKATHDNTVYPDGHLRVSHSRGRNRYYHVTLPDNPDGEYIKKDNLPLAKALAQKDYNKLFLKEAPAELAILESTLSHLSRRNADLSFQKLSESRKELIEPYLSTDEIYTKAWLAKEYKNNPYIPESKIYDTKRGEKVRSKSEAILADMLYEMKIPYHYEKALRLKSGRTIYPDFTLLRVRSREELYLEHFGLLDDTDYLESFLRKLDEYRQSDIYPGKNLLFTYETTAHPLDIKGFRKMLNGILI